MTGVPACGSARRGGGAGRAAAAMALALLALLLSPWAAAAASDPVVLDAFTGPGQWTAAGSDGVRATVRPDTGPHGDALRLDFDLRARRATRSPSARWPWTIRRTSS